MHKSSVKALMELMPLVWKVKSHISRLQNLTYLSYFTFDWGKDQDLQLKLH